MLKLMQFEPECRELTGYRVNKGRHLRQLERGCEEDGDRRLSSSGRRNDADVEMPRWRRRELSILTEMAKDRQANVENQPTAEENYDADKSISVSYDWSECVVHTSA